MEEERRLAYVGMTRARSELYLSVPAVTGHGARQRPTEPSPFLIEIPENLRTAESGADSANLGLTALLPMESMNTRAWS